MNVILLEKIRNLGDLGEQVSVKPGYARNFLYPKRKAIPATSENLAEFQAKRAELEQAAVELLRQAQAQAEAIMALTLTIPAKAGEEGKLFGSIAIRDISAALANTGIQVEKNAIQLPTGPIRHLGEFDIEVILHTDVTTSLKLVIVSEQ